MRYAIAVVALALPLASSVAQPHLDAAARELMPLLKDIREQIKPRLSVEPGTLPPSPITGRSSTLFAVRVGIKSVDVPPRVVEGIDRLLKWDQRQPLNSTDAVWVERVVEEVQVDLMGLLVASGREPGCDEKCVIEHLTNPGALFGPTSRERRERRDELLLNALIDIAEH